MRGEKRGWEVDVPPVLEEYEGENADYDGGIGEHLSCAEDSVPGFRVGNSRDLAEALQRRKHAVMRKWCTCSY